MNFKSIFKHYWKFIKEHLTSQVLILIGYGAATIGTTVIVPLIYKEIIDIITEKPLDAYERLEKLIFLLIITIIVYNIFFRISDYFLIKSQSEMIRKIHDYTLEKLQKHSYAFFSNAFVGGVVAKTKRFVRSFVNLHDQLIFNFWMQSIALISSLIVLWYQSRILGFIFLVWLFLYSFMVVFMVKLQIPKSLINAEADTKTNSRYADVIANILTVKMFGNEDQELKNYKKITTEHEKKRTDAWMQEGFWNGMFQSATIGAFNIAVIWFAINLWKQGVIPAGTIVLVQVYVLTSFNIVWSISRNIIKVFSSLTDANEMVKILDQEPSVKDPENPEKLKITKGKIEFKDVTFNYENSNDVFEKLNLIINPGEKVALIGHSGAGKTTVVKLVLRFIDIQKGKIEIDGQDIRNVSQKDLHSQIAYVPQDPSLFHRTLKENIAYAKPEISFPEIVEASKKSYAHDFIKDIPNGYNSLVGERGIKLSGGERQRVAIARAMIKDSSIVILDEATSSLDSLTEEKIQKAFLELMRGKTTIVIAHRLSTIKKMDRIIVFDKGRIIESGKHEELLSKKGLYFKLWQSQMGGFIGDKDDK